MKREELTFPGTDMIQNHGINASQYWHKNR